MNKTIGITIGLVALALAGCGSEGDAGGGGEGGSQLSGPQAAAAESAMESAAEDGVTLDEGCVEDVAAQLSDADAELAADDADAELSAAGESLGLELMKCADDDEIIELFIASIVEDSGVDEDCARDALGEIDIAEIIASAQPGSEPPADLVEALIPCFEPEG